MFDWISDLLEMSDEDRPSNAKAILDVAERVFAEQGFNGASLRAIARQAGVNQAMIGYYFTSKDGLASATVERRAGAINAERMHRLRLLKAQGIYEVADLVRVLVAPAVELSADIRRGGSHYVRLVALLTSSSDDLSKRILSANFDAIAKVFVREFCKIEPRLSGVNIARSYVYTIAIAMSSVTSDWRTEILAGGASNIGVVDEIVETCVKFCTAGIMALKEPDQK